VLRDCLHCTLPEDSQSKQTTSCVSEHYRNDASGIPGTISVRCAKSLHSERLLPEEMCLCVTRGRHCPTIDSARALTMAKDFGAPRYSYRYWLRVFTDGRRGGRGGPIASKPHGCCGATRRRVSERLSLKAESRRDKLFEANLEK